MVKVSRYLSRFESRRLLLYSKLQSLLLGRQKFAELNVGTSGLSYTGDQSDSRRSLFYTDPRRCLVNKSFYDRLKCDDNTDQPGWPGKSRPFIFIGDSDLRCSRLQPNPNRSRILDRYVAVSFIDNEPMRTPEVNNISRVSIQCTLIIYAINVAN